MAKSLGQLSPLLGVITTKQNWTSIAIIQRLAMICVVVINGDIRYAAALCEYQQIRTMTSTVDQADGHGGGMCGLSGWTSSDTPGIMPM